MGVYIKGMTMPSVCDYCWALDESGDYPMCRITGETRGYNFRVREKRMDKCPLIELPDHGDLIDRDALRQEMRLSDSCRSCERDAYRCQYYDEMTVMDVCGRIDDMPVVIPAERSEASLCENCDEQSDAGCSWCKRMERSEE